MREEKLVRLNNSTAATIGTSHGGFQFLARTGDGVSFFFACFRKGAGQFYPQTRTSTEFNENLGVES
jgi:hypothetical protein